MKTIRKITAIILAATIILSVSAVTGSAITVVHDGNTYYLRTRTPTTGDVNVLMVRVGFADYALDDEDDPADSKETLLSYFDGSPESINGYYNAASYGKLSLACDNVFEYTASLDRSEYDESNTDAASSPEGLLSETLSSLEGKIDFDRYDRDGDGYLDFVCLDFAGPADDHDTTWWPHVTIAEDVTVAGKNIDTYSFLKGDSITFIHEFGHILGAVDYYSGEAAPMMNNAIMTYDIMNNNTGDHNGFTKWSYGWLEDKDIAFADKSSGDTTIKLAPIESPLGDGKKIAVVAPELDKNNSFLDEYFLVEYDSGTGNSAGVFESEGFEPGFRIFHVNARSDYVESFSGKINFDLDNNIPRICLIHNMKSEDGTLSAWILEDSFFREGDSLTPEGHPNTGFLLDDVYNGKYTGISFTDFVTGDEPSFRVSFTDGEIPQVDAELSLEYSELKSDMKMKLHSDTPLTMPEKLDAQTPYLLDKNGSKLPVELKYADSRMFDFNISYTGSYPTIEPNSEYTLVLPEGTFKAGYNQIVPEFRQMVTTSDFTAMTAIQMIKFPTGGIRRSEVFTVTDNTYGMFEMPYTGEGKCVFREYNLNGEEIDCVEFDCPDLGLENGNMIYKCTVTQLNDGNFALQVITWDGFSFVKLDGRGNILSDVCSVSQSSLIKYTDYLINMSFDLYKNGLCKYLYSSSDHNYLFLKIDFENEPQFDYRDEFARYYSIDSNSYVLITTDDDSKNVISIYGQNDELTGEIKTKNSVVGIFEDNGSIAVLNYGYINGKTDYHFFVDTYSVNGELTNRRDITEQSEKIKNTDSTKKVVSTPAGYYIETVLRGERTVTALDKDWNIDADFTFAESIYPVYAGNCGLIEKTAYIEGTGNVNIVFRFNNGDYEIVPKRERQPGDVNGDGSVDILDAAMIQMALVDKITLTPEQLKAADVNGDNTVNILDAVTIQKIAAGGNAPASDQA